MVVAGVNLEKSSGIFVNNRFVITQIGLVGCANFYQAGTACSHNFGDTE